MKLFKKIIISVMTAVLAVCFITSDITNIASFAQTADETSDGAYAPIDSAGYIRWTGSLALKENMSYYIDSEVKISGNKRVTLPKGCRLLIKDSGSLLVYAGSTLTVKGEIVVEPSARVVVSGGFIALGGSSVQNHGTFSGTKSSLFELSSEITTGSKGITAFAGTVNVYKSGSLVNFNRLTFAAESSVTLSGSVVCERSGVLFLKGELTVTVSGSIYSSGSLNLYCNAAVSGTITLAPGSGFYTSGGAIFRCIKSARFIDKRKSKYDFDAPEDPDNASASSEYDSAPEAVNWFGIDVSRYQGAINWNKVKASGVDFVIMRASIGDHEDAMFANYITAAKKAGLMVGVYHYLFAETPEDALVEARLFIDTISRYAIDFPAVLDFEEPSQQNNLTNAERTKIAQVFMDEVKKAGYFPMLYTNKSWAVGYLDMDKLKDYEIWLAEWKAAPTYTGDYGIWQYTARGKVSGIDSDVDLDICTRNYRKLILDGGYNHLK